MKTEVTCKHCGAQFNTPTPFPTTTCRACGKKTPVKLAIKV